MIWPNELSTLGQLTFAVAACVFIFSFSHACTGQAAQDVVLTASDASKLYSCVTGLYGKPVETVIAQCAPEEASLVRDILNDVTLFAERRAAMCAPVHADAGGDR